MVEIQRMTTEEAIIKTLEDDPAFAVMILRARDGDRIDVTITHTFEVVAAYAKPILRDWINRKMAHVTDIAGPES